MKRFILCAFSLALLVTTVRAQQPKTATNPGNKRKPAPSFTDRVLKFLGVSYSPSTLKGPGDEVTSGELWLVDLSSGNHRVLTSGGGYRSPVFIADSTDILVLRGSDAIRVSTSGGAQHRLYGVPNIAKLVGSSAEEPGKILVLLQGEADGHPRVGVLTLGTGAVAPAPYDSSSDRDLQMVESLEGWSRTYGDQQVYVGRQSKQALSGTVEWTDVFRRAGSAPPVDVTNCDGSNCGQPSLAGNKQLLAYVKSVTQ